MEKNDNNIIQLIQKIIFLLDKNDEPKWSFVLKKLLHQYCNLKSRDEAIKNIIQIYKGGMGSFVDLVLQKNYKISMNEEERKILIKENEILNKLRHELYNICVNYCKNNN